MAIPKFVKKSLWIFAILFILLNSIAGFHSYKFTHFVDSVDEKTKNPNGLSNFEKLKVIVFGVKNPRPKNNSFPKQPFKNIILNSNKTIECWSIKTANSKGTIILFHGYGGNKSSLIDKSNVFLELGYSTLLVDFMGSGGSEGNQTTIGFMEAEQVKTSFKYLIDQGEENIILFGTSMGAVAIMKAINDFQINPVAIVIECPFGTMQKTVNARFKNINAPTFPMANLLMLWGGLQNGFCAFSHKPTDYALNINIPTLLLYGKEDNKVSRQEIDQIYSNLKGEKDLKIYPWTGHENYLTKNHQQWENDIKYFLINLE